MTDQPRVRIGEVVVWGPGAFTTVYKLYQRPNGSHVEFHQVRNGDAVVWDSRHAEPTPLRINGRAYRHRARRRTR